MRNIAAVKGVSVMFTGAGTLGGVFSTTGPDGRHVRDDAAWEAANRQTSVGLQRSEAAVRLSL